MCILYLHWNPVGNTFCNIAICKNQILVTSFLSVNSVCERDHINIVVKDDRDERVVAEDRWFL